MAVLLSTGCRTERGAALGRLGTESKSLEQGISSEAFPDLSAGRGASTGPDSALLQVQLPK